MTGAGKCCLLILDGVGISKVATGNAVRRETMPELFESLDGAGHAVLEAAAEAVGLEPGQVGNSEAGHLTIGAGRVVPCLTRRVVESFDCGEWARDPGWGVAVAAGVLHVVGLVSDAGVHGLARTIGQAVCAAREAGVRELVVHPVLDGVDSLAGTAPALLAELRQELEGYGGVSLGVVCGRRWFCDRSGDLTVTQVIVEALTGALELPPFDDIALAKHLETHRSELDFPAHRVRGGRSIASGEPVLITSHRADRARQAARALARTQPVLMLVDPGEDVGVKHVFFQQTPLDRGFAHELLRAGLSSVRIAEKCKFPHVTHFFNGFDAGTEGEGVCLHSIDEVQIPDHPEMSAREVTERIVTSLENPTCRVVVANLANLDQVGHLGRLDLAERAAAEVDRAFARIRDAARAGGWTLFVTADHGNADRVEDESGGPFGSHTDCPVPLLVLPPDGLRFEWSSQRGSLANVAPTCLLSLGLETPEWMAPALGRFAPVGR